MTKPIKPSEVVVKKPDQVFEAFNESISENWNGVLAVVLQRDVVRKISLLMDIPISSVYEKEYLDIEAEYRKHGWDVVYNEPDHNHTFFCFIKKEEPD